MSKITILINDQVQEVPQGCTLEQLIQLNELPKIGCVFSINNTIVPSSEWGKSVVSEGDTISLFQAIAGG